MHLTSDSPQSFQMGVSQLLLENLPVSEISQCSFQDAVDLQQKKRIRKNFFQSSGEDFPISYFVSLYTEVRIYFTMKFIDRDIKRQKSDKINVK